MRISNSVECNQHLKKHIQIMDHHKWIIAAIFVIIFNCIECFDDLNLTKPKNECTRKRNLFLEQLKDYNQCVAQNAVPVSMCRQCLVPYVTTLQSFSELSTTMDPQVVRVRCIDHFMNQDALNIVWVQYQSARDLWDKAACSNCFVDSCDPDKIPSGGQVNEICKVNKNVINIGNLTENFEKCLNESDRHQGNNCNDCLNNFNTLSVQFSQLSGSSNGVCFEVVDQYNRSSNIWYNEKKCPRPKVISNTGWTVMIVILSLIISGVASFGGYYLFVKYRQHGSYVAQTNSEESGTSTPPIYS